MEGGYQIMAKKIDEQVVQLKFDNAQFEKNVNKSMSTLDKLKNALKFKGAEEGINNVQKSMNKLDFSQIENLANKAGFHIQDVWNKMSSYLEYQVAGKVVRAGENMIKSLSVDQITAGYSKYEEKTQNVQTLINSTGKSLQEVNKYLDELMWYSDETSFGFNDMTSALATMTSSGGDIDKLIPMIEGMGNAVAFAGKGAAEFQRVIFNLNQSYSTGSLMTMDWRSVQNAGAASKQLQEYLIEAAEQVGTINKGTGKLENFSEYLSKKKITSEAMEIAFTRFAEYTNAVKAAVDSGEYETATEAMEHMSTDGFGEISVSAFKAAQNAKSFTEAVEATKDAVSSGWMKIFETIFGDYQEATALWTDLCNDLWEIFASGFEGTQDKLDKVMKTKWGQFTDVIDSAGISVEDFMRSYGDVLGLSEDMSKTIYNNPEKFKKWFEDGTLSADRLTEAVKRLGSGETEVIKVNEKAQKVIDDINRVTTLSNKEYSNTATKEEKEELISLRKELLKQGNFLDQYNIAKEKSYKNEKLNLFDLSEAQLEHLGYTKEEINQMNALKDISAAANDETSNFYDVLNHTTEMSGRELLTGSFANALHGIMQMMDVIGEAWGEIFTGKSTRGWIDLLQKIYDWTSKLVTIYKNWGDENAELSETGEKLKNTFKGVFAVFDILWQLVKSVAQGIWDLASAFGLVGDGILSTTSNIGTWLTNLDETIKKNNVFGNVISKISHSLVRFIENIKDVIAWLKQLWPRIADTPAIKQFTSFFDKTFGGVLKNIKSKFASFSGMDGAITKPLKKITEEAKKFNIDKIGDKIVGFFKKLDTKWITEKLKVIKDAFEKIKDTFSNISFKSPKEFFSSLSEAFGNLGNTISEAFEKIKSAFKKFDFSKFKSLFSMGLGLATFFTFRKGIKAIVDAFGEFGGIGKAVKDTLGALQDTLGLFQKKLKADIFLKIAIAIGILAGACAALTLVDQTKLRSAAMVMVSLAASIALLIGLLGGFKVNATAGFAVVEIVAGLLGIVAALMLLDKINFEDEKFRTKLVLLATIFTTLALITLILESLDIGGFNSLGILPLCAGLLVVCLALKMIVDMQPEQLLTGTLSIISIITALGVAYFLMKMFGGNLGRKNGLLSFCLSIFVMELVLKYIVKHGVKLDEVLRHIDSIGAVFGALLGLAVIMRVANGKVDNKNTGLNLLLMAISVYVLGLAMEKIGQIPTEALEKGLAAVGILELCMGASIALMSLGNEKTIDFKTMIVIVVGIIALCVALYGISQIPFGELKYAIFALSVTMLSFGECVNLINKNIKVYKKGQKAKAHLLGAVLSLIAIAGVLYLLTKYGDNLDKMPYVAASISLCLLAIGGVAAIMSKIDGRKFGKKKFAALMAGVLAMAALGVVLTALTTHGNNFEKAIPLATAMSIALVAVVGTMLLMEKFGKSSKFNSKQLAAIMSGVLAMLVIGIVIGALTTHATNLDKAIPVALALGIAISAVGGVLILLNRFGGDSKKAALNALGLVIAAVALIPIAYALGLLCQMAANIDNVIEITAALVLALSGLAGVLLVLGMVGQACPMALVWGVLAIAAIGITIELLVYIGTQLVAAIGNLDIAVVDNGIEIIKHVFTGIGEAISGFVSGLFSQLPTLGQYLSDFTSNASSFFDTINGLDSTFSEKVETLVNGLLKLIAAEFLSTIVDFIPFGNDMTDLAEMLNDFGSALIDGDFLSMLDLLDPAKVDAAKNLSDMMLSLTKSELLSGVTSFVEKFTGSSSMNDFASALTDIGKGIGDFADSVAGKDFKNVDAAVEGAKQIAGLEEMLSKKDGLIQAIVGQTDLGEFGENLSSFGLGISKFSDSVSGENKIDVDAISDAATAAGYLADLENNLRAHKGALQDLLGDADLSTFGAELISFAIKFVRFVNYLAVYKDSFDQETVQLVADIGTIMANLENSLKGHNGFIQDFAGDQTLSEFGSSMISFAVNLTQFCQEIKSLNSGMVTKTGFVVDICSALDGMLESRSLFDGKISLSEFGKDLQTFGSAFGAYTEYIAQSETANLSTFANHFSSLGDTYAKLQGVDPNALKNFITPLKDIQEIDSEEFTEMLTLFNEDMVSGIADTMLNMTEEVGSEKPKLLTAMEQCMSEMSMVITASYDQFFKGKINTLLTKCKSQIRNERTAFYSAGAHVAEGFVQGIESKFAEAEAAAAKLASLASGATSDELEVKSPSRVYKRIGAYATEGFIIGISSYKKQVYDSGVSLSDAVIEGTNSKIGDFISILSDTDDFNPVIRPTLDLSNVMSGAKQVGAIFNNSKLSASVDGSQNGGKSDASNNVTYNQYNYSPKALSRIDIYRQTRNQLSMSKG